MLKDDTASSSLKLNFNHLEASPSASSHGIEFPSSSTNPISSVTKDAQLPQKKSSSSLHHFSLSRSTTAPRCSEVPVLDLPIDLSRASLDRRISLPLLGIDLGRSGPSYGQTLKRMSVAVYGMAHNAFDSEDMSVSDLTSRLKPPLRTPPPGVVANRLVTDTRPSLSVSFSDPEGSYPNSSGRNSSSNEAIHSQERVQDEHPVIALQSLITNTPNQVLLSRSQSAQSSKVPPLRIQRDLQGRRLNLPFKTNVKYPLKGVKFESNKLGKHKFPCPPDPNADTDASLDAHQDAKLTHDSLDLSTTQLDVAIRETKLKKKRQTVQELIESERRYFDLLNKIQLNYILPIQATQQTTDHQKMILSRKTAAHIFSNFTAILGLSSQFLASLEKFGSDHGIFNTLTPPLTASISAVTIQSPSQGMRSHSKSTNYASRGFNIGEIMMQFLPFFKLYTTFTSNFSVSQSTLHLHSAKSGPSPEFVKLLEDCHRRGIDGGLGLAHMLLGIIQRVPRYELLIKELVKHSVQTDCEYNDLLSAQKMVGSVVRGLEIWMNEQIESKTILTIQRAMEGLPFPLVIPSRKLVKIGQLKKINRKGDLQDRIFFLFNDCLIYSGTIRNGNVESIEKWLGKLTASFQKSHTASNFSASSTVLKPITTSFLLPFTYGDANSPRLIYCRKMELHDVTIIGAVSGQKNNSSVAFQIISSSKSFIVYTRDAFEKESWIGCLRETKSELLDSRRTLFIKEDARERENTLKFDKLGYIAESPSQELSPLTPTVKEAFNSDSRRETIDKTPQRTGRENGTTFLPMLSNCGTSGTVTSSMVTSFLSPRGRHASTLTKSFNFNWKNLVQLGIPPLNIDQTTQILDHAQESHKKSLETNVKSPSKSNSFPEPNLTHQVSNQKQKQVEEYKSWTNRYVAENYCAPVWIPDSHVNRCMGQCQTWFNVLKRRHHCRMCGGVFCASCSSRMFLITNQEQGDQIARACEGCFKSVFLDLDSAETKYTSGEVATYRPILSNRLHDDQELLFRRDRPHLKHSHRQSLPIDMGSAHFRHSLANIRDDDRRGSIISSGTSVGGESTNENSKNVANFTLKTEASLHQNQTNNSTPIPITSNFTQPTHTRQRLSSLLQNHIR